MDFSAETRPQIINIIFENNVDDLFYIWTVIKFKITSQSSFFGGKDILLWFMEIVWKYQDCTG